MAHLYKYFSLNNGKIKETEEMLKTNTIKLSDGINFNDPFDIRITNRKTKKLIHVKGFKILCLTNSYKNKLMWSHYADSYKGICVTLDICNSLVYPVHYTRERIYDNTNLDEIFLHTNCIKPKKNLTKAYSMSSEKKLAFVKDSSWSYEHEYRVAFYKEETSRLIDKEKLNVKVVKVYLGACIDPNIEEYIKNICLENSIPFTKITFSTTGYKIEIKKP